MRNVERVVHRRVLHTEQKAIKMLKKTQNHNPLTKCSVAFNNCSVEVWLKITREMLDG
jgi:hypothetical protein